MLHTYQYTNRINVHTTTRHDYSILYGTRNVRSTVHGMSGAAQYRKAYRYEYK